MDKNFFTVGELSKMTGVSKQAIRYYDKVGLLKPGKIGKENAYRYYDPMHILYLNTIMRLSQLGCSLKETSKYLNGLDLYDVKNMLRRRKILTEKKIIELTSALNSLDNQIQLIDEGLRARDCEDVMVKILPERHYIFVTNYSPLDLKHGIIQVNTLVKELNSQNMLFVGSPVMEITGDKGLLKTGFFYNKKVETQGFLTESLPAGRYACAYHKGIYDEMSKTVKKLNTYLKEQGLKPASGIYQLYLIDYALTHKDDELLTEIQVRVSK